MTFSGKDSAGNLTSFESYYPTLPCRIQVCQRGFYIKKKNTHLHISFLELVFSFRHLSPWTPITQRCHSYSWFKAVTFVSYLVRPAKASLRQHVTCPHTPSRNTSSSVLVMWSSDPIRTKQDANVKKTNQSGHIWEGFIHGAPSIIQIFCFSFAFYNRYHGQTYIYWYFLKSKQLPLLCKGKISSKIKKLLSEDTNPINLMPLVCKSFW